MQAFTFIYLSLSIPITIFDLIDWHTQFNESTENTLLSLYHVPFTVFKLSALTIIPSKVITEVRRAHHTLAERLNLQIRAIERTLHANLATWAQYGRDLDRLTRKFIAKVLQPDVGISLWGFAVITRGLVFTVRATSL